MSDLPAVSMESLRKGLKLSKQETRWVYYEDEEFIKILLHDFEWTKMVGKETPILHDFTGWKVLIRHTGFPANAAGHLINLEIGDDPGVLVTIQGSTRSCHSMSIVGEIIRQVTEILEMALEAAIPSNDDNLRQAALQWLECKTVNKMVQCKEDWEGVIKDFDGEVLPLVDIIRANRIEDEVDKKWLKKSEILKG